MATKKLQRSAFDTASVRDVTAWAVLFNGSEAGKVVCSYGGARTLATISIWAGPWRLEESATGDATGGGYCRRSGAIADAAIRHGAPLSSLAPLGGSGLVAIQRAFEAAGYEIIEVL